mmetsp:Transcript_29629/g.64457  ORF Transcript_29629/g.64457 Transcript_29629/m.64457 type:complete len:258 (-) Transcript_29629:281-1054(-)
MYSPFRPMRAPTQWLGRSQVIAWAISMAPGGKSRAMSIIASGPADPAGGRGGAPRPWSKGGGARPWSKGGGGGSSSSAQSGGGSSGMKRSRFRGAFPSPFGASRPCRRDMAFSVTATDPHSIRPSSESSCIMESMTCGRAALMAVLEPIIRTIWWPSKDSFSTKTLAPVSSRSALMLAPRGPMSRPVTTLGRAARRTNSPGSLPIKASASSGRIRRPGLSDSAEATSTIVATMVSRTCKTWSTDCALITRTRKRVCG